MNLEKGVLGNKIRQARIEHNLTQEQLAEQLGISPTHMKHIESEHRKPSLDVLVNIIQILNISFDSLIFKNKITTQKEEYIAEIKIMLSQCNIRELRAIRAALQEL